MIIKVAKFAVALFVLAPLAVKGTVAIIMLALGVLS